MRAAVFQGAGKALSVEQVPDPSPGPGLIVVKVGRCGICGTDLHITSGHGFMELPPDIVLGHEYAGEVVAVGPDNDRFEVGDHVTALAIPSCGQCARCQLGTPQWCTGDAKLWGSGAYAEYALVPVTQAVKLPESMSWQEGALVEPLAVGLHGVQLARLAPSDRVLVLGAGPIALGVVHWARQMGAGNVVVMAASRRRERYAAAMGATTFLAPESDHAAAAMEALGGPADVVFEAAGVPGAIERALEIAKPQGRVIVLGWCDQPDTFVPAIHLMKELNLQFSMTYTVAEFTHVIRNMEEGRVDGGALVSATVSLDELPDQFEALRGATEHCKVMIAPWA